VSTARSPLYLRRHGTGRDTVVGLHGWNGSHRTFDPLLPHLPETHSLVALDLPGYGRSAPPHDWAIPKIAGRVAEHLDDRLPASVTLVGNCSGAPLSLFVADRLETHVSRIHMLEPFAWVPWYMRLLILPVLGPLFYRTAFDTRLGRTVANTVMADQRRGETDLMASFADTPVDVPYRYLRALDRLDFPADFEEPPAEIRLVRAAHTFEAVRRSVEAWRSIWPEARTRTIAGAGHLVLEEAPEKVARLLFR